jgi:hypothetical protein
MRLNTRGQVAAGVGSGAVSIDGVVIGLGGSPAWLTDDEIVYGRTLNGREDAVAIYDTRTRAGRVAAPGGANDVKAGGGMWARWLGDGKTGLTTSTGFGAPKAGLLEVGPDGVLYYVPDRQSDRGIVARYPDGREVVVTTGPTALSLRGVVGGCVWVGPDLRAHVWNLPQPVTPTGLGVYGPRAGNVNGEWWLVYGDGLRILAQPFAKPEGYIVASFGNTFDLDCVVLNGKLHIAYATTQGEQPGQYHSVELDLSRPRVTLSTSRPTQPPAPPQLPKEPPDVTISIPNHLDVVKEARARYADKSGPERAGLICNCVAWKLRNEGAGTFYKPSGDNWNQRSMDVIIYKPNGETFDILSDAEGDANPQWARTKPSGVGDPAKWRAATDPSGLTAPPTPPPPPPPDDDSVREALIAIRDRLDALLAKL